MKKKSIAKSAAVLAIFTAGYFVVIFDGNIRTVEFLSIFAIGIVAGILLTQIFNRASKMPTEQSIG